MPLVLAGFGFLAVADGDSGLRMWARLREDVALGRERVDALVQETEALRGQIEALEKTTFALEKAIREDLELARPGEVIVRFRDETNRSW